VCSPQLLNERKSDYRRDLLMESEAWLISRFRLPRHVIIELRNNLDARLKRETRRSNALPVPAQVLATLGFLATSTFKREISQPTISRTMPAVLAAIKSLSRRCIQFPYNDAQQSVIKRQFYESAGFPNLVGAIDCTHLRLKASSMNDYAFINRKNYHSINVQVICDANCVGAWLQEGALQSQTHLRYPLPHSGFMSSFDPTLQTAKKHILILHPIIRTLGLVRYECFMNHTCILSYDQFCAQIFSGDYTLMKT
uniref:Putative nuclease HARBI1 n=1 Tax=Seriola lalandi dorsalis TaxID=1841481 RepID=A0A3B4XQX1_SERLL